METGTRFERRQNPQDIDKNQRIMFFIEEYERDFNLEALIDNLLEVVD